MDTNPSLDVINETVLYGTNQFGLELEDFLAAVVMAKWPYLSEWSGQTELLELASDTVSCMAGVVAE